MGEGRVVWEEERGRGGEGGKGRKFIMMLGGRGRGGEREVAYIV